MKLTDMLKKFELFEGMRSADLDRIASRMKEVVFSKDTVVLEENGKAKGFFVIMSGGTAVYKDFGTSRQRRVNRLKKGEFFGDMSLLDDSPGSRPSATVVASTKTLRCMVLSRREFNKLDVFSRPELSKKFLKNHIRIIQAKEAESSREVVRVQEAIIISLARLAEFRDPETGAHLERIQAYCKLIAETERQDRRFKKQIDDDFIDMIYMSTPLHDIGKVGVRDNVLLKRGKLTDQEFKEIKRHPVLGARAIKGAMKQIPVDTFLSMGYDIALGHHEKVDGTGYPYGKKGNQIPLSARIAAIADVYDALRSDRWYRNPPQFGHKAAKEIMLEGRGTHLDAALLDLFFSREYKLKKIWASFKGARAR